VILDGPSAAAAVVVPGNGSGDPAQARIVRIEMQTGASTTSGLHPGASNLTLAGDALWFSGSASRGIADTDARALVALDPITLAEKRRIELPATPGAGTHGLTGTSADIWVTNGGSILDIDPRTGRLKQAIAVPAIDGDAVSIALEPGGGHLYVGTSSPDTGMPHLIEWATGSGTLLASTYLNTIGAGTPQQRRACGLLSRQACSAPSPSSPR